MSTIEIKQRKKMVAYFLSFCLLVITATTLGVFFTDKYKDNTRSKIAVVAGFLLFLYITYPSIKKLIKNEPVIILKNDSIVFHGKGSIVIPKTEIKEIDVVFVEEQGTFLKITTDKKVHEFNITWLEVTAEQMKELIKNYRPSL